MTPVLTPEQAAEVRTIIAEMIGQALRDIPDAITDSAGLRLRCIELATALCVAAIQSGVACDPIVTAREMIAFMGTHRPGLAPSSAGDPEVRKADAQSQFDSRWGA